MLAGTQFGDAEAAQGFHVDEDVRGPVAGRQEAEAANPVEPLHLEPLEAAGRLDRDVRPRRRHLSRVLGGRIVHRQDAEGLQSAGPGQCFDDDARPLIGGLVAVAPEAGHMQENIGAAIIGYDEAEPLGHVEPLDRPHHLDDIEIGVTAVVGCRVLSARTGLVGPEPGLFTVGCKLGPHASSLFVLAPPLIGVRHI